MQQIISDHINQIRNLCIVHRVEKLFVFGSVCTERFSPQSDVDLIISFQPMEFADYTENYFAMAEGLEEILQRPVDLVTEKSIANPYFIEAISKTKTLIYGS
jgi:predicted nucleotidyltransferase